MDDSSTPVEERSPETRSGGTPPEPRRITRLDGLRGVAACVVAFFYHPQNLFVLGAFDQSGAVVTWFHQWGWAFVDLFFVLSGYVFAHVYLDGRLQSRVGMSSFAVARVARLYPLHLLTLFICAALFWDEPRNTLLTFIGHLFMLQGVLGPEGRGFNGPSWSISVEILCYILFAVAASSSRRALYLVTAGAIGITLVHFLAFGEPGGPWSGDLIPRGLLGFFIGQVLWHARAPLARVPTVVFVGVLAFGCVIDVGSFSPVLPLTILAWPAALLLALRLRAMETAPLRWLGDRSYSIYLIHQPIVYSVGAFYGRIAGPDWVIWGVHALFIAVVLLLSDISYRFFERPCRTAIREAWERRRKSRERDLPATAAS
ncbi:MAG: acyltransferase [Novosphingobium sp.]